VELQDRLPELKSQGLSIVAVSYDPVETLAKFAADRKIMYPLLSDRGSAIIRRYNLLNASVERDSRSYGVPHPGTFMLDARRRVTSRFFEERYQERNTAASIVVRQGGAAAGPIVTARNQHLTMTASASDTQVAPGSRITLAFDVTPARNIHVYAPGDHTYQVIAVHIDPQPALLPHNATYPPSETYYFAPLNETVAVYQKPFRLTRDVTIAATREAQQALRELKTLTVSGKLEYQACDDKVCFRPIAIPFALELQIKALVRPPQNH
jgi:hypothetical protein